MDELLHFSFEIISMVFMKLVDGIRIKSKIIPNNFDTLQPNVLIDFNVNCNNVGKDQLSYSHIFKFTFNNYNQGE